ncbi:MAG TPA: hypothetical protein VIC26_09635 [Marinagarivorans sp.]
MFKILHEGEALGTTLFESGDPEVYSVSGAFNNLGGAIALSAWIVSNGGAEDGEVVYRELDAKFTVTTADGVALDFVEGTLIAVPNEGEAFVEIVIRDQSDYQQHFPEHVSAVATDA